MTKHEIGSFWPDHNVVPRSVSHELAMQHYINEQAPTVECTATLLCNRLEVEEMTFFVGNFRVVTGLRRPQTSQSYEQQMFS